MKRVIAIGLMCSLSACASMYGKDSNPESNKMAQAKTDSRFDDRYISMVERQAIQHGVVVKWVNPPKAPKSKKDG